MQNICSLFARLDLYLSDNKYSYNCRLYNNLIKPYQNIKCNSLLTIAVLCTISKNKKGNNSLLNENEINVL